MSWIPKREGYGTVLGGMEKFWGERLKLGIQGD